MQVAAAPPPPLKKWKKKEKEIKENQKENKKEYNICLFDDALNTLLLMAISATDIFRRLWELQWWTADWQHLASLRPPW